MNIKKLIAGSTAIVVVATQAMTGLAYADNHGEVNTEWTNAVNYMKENNLSSTANSVDEYAPMAEVKREAASKFFVNFAKNEFGMEADGTRACNFNDMDEAQEWAEPYIVEACQMGILKGADGNFMPQATLTKMQFLTVLARIAKNDSSIEPTDAFNVLKSEGITNEDDLSSTVRPVSRIELAMLFQRGSDEYAASQDSFEEDDEDSTDIGDILGDILGEDDEDTTSDEDTTDEDTTSDEDTTDEDTSDEDTTSDVEGSKLEVSLNPETQSSMDVASWVNSFDTMKFDLAAGDEDVVVSSMTIERVGLGSSQAVEAAVLFADGMRISKAKSFNTSEDIAVLNLNPQLVVKAGTVKTVTVKTEVAEGGNSFAIKLTDMVANTAIDMGVVQSSKFDVKNVDAIDVSLREDNTFSDPYLWEEQAPVFSFEVENNDSNEDIDFESITFEQDGGADLDEDITNINLYHNNDLVAEGKINDDYVTFELSEAITIDSSNDASFEIRADIVGGAEETIEFVLENNLDVSVSATDEYNFTSVSWDDLNEGNELTIQAGDLTIIDTDPEKTTVREDTDDVILGTFKIVANAGTQLEMEDFAADIAMNNSGVNEILENVELRDVTNGITYDLETPGNGTEEKVGDTNLGIYFDSSEEITFQVRADIKNDLTNFGDETIQLSIDVANDIKIVETADDEKVEDITPSSITFKKIEGSESSFDINVLPMSDKKSAVVGSQDIEVLTFEVSADDSTELEVRELKVYGDVDGTAITSSHVSQYRLYKDSVSDANLVSTKSASRIASNGVLRFDALNEDISRNGKAKFVVTVDLVDDEDNETNKLNFAVAGYEIRDDDNDKVYLDGDTDGDITDEASTYGSARTVTIEGAGTLTLSADNTDDEVDTEKNVIAGTMSDFVASYELTAQNEAVLIEDLTITGSDNLEQSVSEIVLYQDDKSTEIARESVSSSEVTFSDVNYVVNEGSENLYVKVITRSIGKDRAGQTWTYSLTMEIDDAEGNESGKDVTVNNSEEFGYEFDVNTVGVTTPAVAEDLEGDTLKDGWSTTVAKMSIAAQEHDNTNDNGTRLKTNLEKLVFDVSASNISGSTTTGAFSLKKVWGNDTAIPATGGTFDITSGTVIFDLSDFDSTDDELSTSTSTYEVRVAADVDDTSKNAYIELELSSGTGAVEFGDDNNGTWFDLQIDSNIEFGELEYVGN